MSDSLSAYIVRSECFYRNYDLYFEICKLYNISIMHIVYVYGSFVPIFNVSILVPYMRRMSGMATIIYCELRLNYYHTR